MEILTATSKVIIMIYKNEHYIYHYFQLDFVTLSQKGLTCPEYYLGHFYMNS